jgi:hypothetical protein
MQRGNLTMEAGLRYDRQTGAARPSATRANPTFPDLVPGIQFAGVDLPFDWNTWSPRAGVTYAIDDSRRTVLRGSVSRFAGQMTTALAGFVNPASSVGYRQCRWNDADGDNLATADEVLLDQLLSVGGGFNAAASATARTSANQLAPDIKTPVTTSAAMGADIELGSHVSLSALYTYSRTSNHVGNVVTRVGLTRADYSPGPNVTGTLPEGLA